MSNARVDGFVELNLFAAEEDFFSATFTECAEFKRQLVIRYSHGIQPWMKRADPGRIVTEQSKLEKLWKNHGVEACEVLLLYMEKVRKRRLLVLYNGSVMVNKNGWVAIENLELDGQELYLNGSEEAEDICLSETIVSFLEDYKMLYEYENSGHYFHPEKNMTYEERSNYFKVLLLGCTKNTGMTASQIYHLADVAKNFGLSSNAAENAVKEAVGLTLKEQEEAWDEMLQRFAGDNKENLLRDVLYLIYCGGYDCKAERIAREKIGRAFSVGSDKIDALIYKMEEF